MARCVPSLDVQCPASRFFNAVRLQPPAEVQVRLAHRCVLVREGRCIPRVQRLLERVRWAWVRRFHLRERRAPAAGRVVRREGPVSAMFRAA